MLLSQRLLIGTIEEGHDPRAGAGIVRGEGAVVPARRNTLFHSPRDRLRVARVGRNIGEGSGLGRCGRSVRAVEEGDDLLLRA